MMNVSKRLVCSSWRLARKLRCSLFNPPLNTVFECNSPRYCSQVPPHDVFISKAPTYRGARNELFESAKVQEILTRLTGLNLDKVFRKRMADELTIPTYTLANEFEMNDNDKEVQAEAAERLKIPVLRDARKPIDLVIDENPDLIAFDDDGADYVFTDISASVDNQTRAILVRENATGVLREGNWDLRDRINSFYWPKKFEKEVETPPVFLEENLIFMLTMERHEEVLDFLYIQFEDDAPLFSPILHRVYDDLAEKQRFDILASTRHYGGMMFYFVANKKTTVLLDYFLLSERVNAAADVVRLHSLVHTDFECDIKASDESVVDNFLKFYEHEVPVHGRGMDENRDFAQVRQLRGEDEERDLVRKLRRKENRDQMRRQGRDLRNRGGS